MDNTAPLPDPTQVTSWPQAVVFCVLIICVVALPSVLTHLGNRKVKKLEQTLTTNNGGSHLKDQFDRIEKSLSSVDARLNALEEQSGSVLSNLFRRF